MKVIQQRLQQKREQVAREEKAGFPRREAAVIKYSYYDNCSKNASDVERDSLTCSLILPSHSIAFTDRHYRNHLPAEGVPAKIIHLLQQVYEGTASCVRVNGRTSEDFPVHTGVRQGFVSSPILFNTVVDAIMRKVFIDRRGVQFGDNDYITDLMFADDSLIFADTEAEASVIIHDIKSSACSYDLTINADKTKVFTSDGSRAIINLQQVQHFKYLGSIAEEQKIAATAGITNRIGQTAVAFGTLTWCFWCKSNINISTKMRIFKSLILSALLYGAESWTLLQRDLKKLEMFQMRCLRRILGMSIRDKIRNETIREWCYNEPTIYEEVQK